MECIWRENPNGPINWDYASKEKRHTNEKAAPYRVLVFGWVDKTYQGQYQAGIPTAYGCNEDTGEESDCQDLGTFDTLQEAQQAVEANYCPEYYV